MNYSEACRHLSKKLLLISGQDTEKEDILTYSLEILIINTINITLTIFLGFFTGVLKSTIACLAVAFLFRHTAGGAHCASALRCAVVTVLLFPSISLFSQFLSKILSTCYLSSINAVVISISAWFFAYLAPAANENAPVISPKRRTKLKLISIAVYITVSTVTLFLYKHGYIELCTYTSIVLCILWCVFIMTGPGKILFGYIDKIKIKAGR